MNRFYILLSAFIFTLLSGLSTTLTADDTEIYLRQVPSLNDGSGRPNILFILDRSSSMKWKDRDEKGNLLYNGTDRLTRLKEALLQMLTEIQNVNVGFMGFSGYAGAAVDGVTGGNAAVLFPITYIDEEAKNVPGELDDSARLSIPIADYADDAEEGNKSGKVYLDDKTLEVVYSGDTQASLTASATANYSNIFLEYKEGDNAGTIDRTTHRFYLGSNISLNPPVPVFNGLRFVDVGIPQGATIQNASVTFVPSSMVNGTLASRNKDLQLKIRTVLADDATDLGANVTYSISKNWADQTSDEVNWNPGNWSEFIEYSTSDISPLIQQVVDRAGWKSGNALGVVFENDGDYTSSRLFDHVNDTPVLNVSYTLEGGGTIINSSVSYGNDNGFEYKQPRYGKTYVYNDEKLNLGYSPNRLTETIVGLRFRNILIPPKAIIKSAKIEMTRLDYSTNTTDLKVLLYGEDADDTTEFVEGKDNFDISKRPKTSNQITWEVPNVGRNKTLTTPDMTQVVQEIVDRDGWLSGNSMAFLMQHVEGDTLGRRQIATFSGDGALSRGAVLTILYEEEQAEDAEARESELQKVGLRFQNVGIPQGARITNAYIDFTSGFAATDEAIIDIHGEDAGNSEAFSNSNTISERKRTTSRVVWNAEPWEWTDGSYSSPAITNIVQEVVNKSDWCGNNALSFIFTASSSVGASLPLRNVVAYDTDPLKAPVLKVEYDLTSVKDNACMRYLFTKQISDANDDMEETDGDKIVYADSRTLDMTTKNGNGRMIGLRFQDIPMASDTKVLSAKLIFTALKDVPIDSSDESALSRSVTLKVSGEATGNSEPFEADNGNLSNRSKTDSVTWTINAADVWQTGRRYSSVDIGPVIQDIVKQGGWAVGNALSLFIEGSGLRQASSFERSLTDAPMLQVEVKGSLSQSASTVRERMKLMVENIEIDSTTPLVDTIYEAALYLEGRNVTFGKDRKFSRTKRVSHKGSWKGGELVRPDGCTGSDPWAVECQGEKITGNAIYTPPEFDECQKTYIVFLSDGGATANSSYKLVPKLTGKSCQTINSITNKPYEYNRLEKDGSESPTTNIDELCGVDVVRYLHEKDLDTSLEGKQNVIVHTVGFNLGTYYDVNGNKKPFESSLNERAVPYLKEWAKEGGGNFYEASSASELTEIFRTIISSAMTESTSFAAPTLSVNTFNRMFHRNEVYFSLFKPGHTQRWDGNIKKYEICIGGTSCQSGDILDATKKSAVAGNYISDNAKSFWSSETDGADVLKGGAGERLLKNSSRKIYTFIGDASPETNHGIDLSDTPVSDEFVTKEALGDEFMSDERYQNIINWIKGVDVMGDYDDESPFNTKRWLLTDLLHSSPVTITYGGNSNKPVAKLVVGTNDGLIRMFDTSTGNEEWAFLPQELFGIQEGLMNNAKGARIYGIDGTASIRIRDSNDNGTIDGDDYVQMFIGMRRGGRNLYALDITDFRKPKLMWVIKGGIEGDDYEYLGQTWSRPKLARVYYNNDPKTVLIFGGGYHGDDESNSGGMGNGIYIVDPDTGKLLWRAGDKDDARAHLGLENMVYPIPSDIALVDSNADAITDRLYVGDIGGQVWRVDLPVDLNDANVGVGGRLAMVSDLEDNKNPQVMHRRRFFYPPEVVRLSDLTYSDSPDYFIVTMTSGTRPSPLNVETHDRFYAFRDTTIGTLEGKDGQADNYPTIEDNDLYDVTENLIQEGNETQVKKEVEDLKESPGWRLCLTESKVCSDKTAVGAGDGGAWIGEKGLASPVILDGKVFFTTYLPSAAIEQNPDDVCGLVVPDGESRLYALDLLTGGAAYNFDKSNNNEDGGGDGDSNLNSGDRHMSLGTGVVSDLVTAFTEDGNIGLVSTDLSLLKNGPRIQSDIDPTFWMQE
ncbi:PilC/PilY family type IV pilus protein [Candidatus Albibeggiatoa sp. nov. NOAA]|uniref:PilC/PilY family type IV pilus protein n=1 Tax=Candidatus Albibeggiatoa sp. nov. NOAA TaxID=3162724 RepID=UPI0032FCE10C|nr:PilC/PilY family type IV pilus protein [Thiotrichaceae bacterium]